MKFKLLLAAFYIFLLSVAANGGEMPVIKILYDSTSVKKEIKTAWGFSALIEFKDKNILFDTGGDAEILIHNMKKMGIDPQSVDYVFISHEHWDHVAGLAWIQDQGAQLLDANQFKELIPSVYTTGKMGKDIKEHSLIIDTPKGLVIVTGCSHPGIVQIVKLAKKKLNKKVYLIVGGCHLYKLKADQIRKVILELKDLGVLKVAPCHCTGKKAIAIFEKEYKEGFIKASAGSIIDLNK